MNLAVITPIAEKAAKAALKKLIAYAKSDLTPGAWRVAGTWASTPIEGRTLWRIAVDQRDPLRLVNEQDGISYILPLREFDSDGGSIPEVARKAAQAAGMDLGRWAYPVAYLIHDGLYACAKIVRKTPSGAHLVDVERKWADAILCLSLQAANATGRKPAIRADAWAITDAVRHFGWIPWRQHRGAKTPGYVFFEWANVLSGLNEAKQQRKD